MNNQEQLDICDRYGLTNDKWSEGGGFEGEYVAEVLKKLENRIENLLTALCMIINNEGDSISIADQTLREDNKIKRG
jgi:hypothetical protein